MELIEGYKKTEVGVIPEDWELRLLGDIFTFYSTSNFSKAEMSLEGEVGCIHYGLIHAINNTSFSLSNGVKFYVTKKQAKYETILEEDVVMVDASEDLEGLNKSVEVSNLKGKEFISGLHTFHLRDKTSVFAKHFKGLILNSDATKKQMLKLAVGLKVFGVSKPQLQQVLLPVPPFTEQKAIAQVLSDTDALIQVLEKKIAKKKLIKKGVMQKLLTPKDGWDIQEFEGLCKTFTKQTGFDYSTHIKPTLLDSYQRGTIPFIQNKDFEGFWFNFETDYYIPEEVANRFPMILMDERCLLISISGKIGNVGVFHNTKKSFVGGAIAIAKFKNPNLLNWVMIYLQSEEGQAKLFNNVKAGSHQNLILDDIRKIKIPIPNEEEQQEISNILSDIDKEIDQEEQKLAKYKQAKQGMMQQLLTGKIRLV